MAKQTVIHSETVVEAADQSIRLITNLLQIIASPSKSTQK